MPYLPKSNRDASAMLELSLAEQLRELNPGFNVARVDLSPFPTVRAKIDCMTISQAKGITGAEIRHLNDTLTGTVTRPNERPRTASIHDPTPADLKHLIKVYPDARVEQLEIAVDAFLPYGSNDVYLLRQLKEQLRHCIAPHRHARFVQTKRVYWDLARNRRSHDGVSNPTPLTTISYLSNKSGQSLKIYLKTIDQGKPTEVCCLRTELALEGAASEWAGIDCVADLPRFGKDLRTYASKAFFIGSGFKNDDTGQQRWRKYGAAWTINDDKGLIIQPDAEANQRYGNALGDLGRSLQRLAA